jgi:hypothetical protein
MGIAMKVLGLCDEFSCKNRLKFGTNLALQVTWKLG